MQRIVGQVMIFQRSSLTRDFTVFQTQINFNIYHPIDKLGCIQGIILGLKLRYLNLKINGQENLISTGKCSKAKNNIIYITCVSVYPTYLNFFSSDP